MSWVYAAVTVGTTAYGAIQSNQAKKAAQGAANAAKVDINALNEQIKKISTQNAIDSQNLERQLNPEVYALRQAATAGVGSTLKAGESESNRLRELLNDHLNKPLPTPLLQAAIDKAKSDLALGGKIDPETQNLITRHALATSGSVTGGGGSLGRDLTARDLGLTSLGLQNTRLQNASQIGGQEQQGAQMNYQNLLANLAQQGGLSSDNFARYLSAAQLGQSIQAPNVGIDPSSAANIAVGNQNVQSQALANQANIAGQQSQSFLNAAGQFGGLYAMNKMNSGGGGTGAKTNYADFVKNNPQSYAAIGQH